MNIGSRIARVLVVTLVALALPNPAVADPKKDAYLAVIDAGSSGSRLTLYADDPNSLVPVVVTRLNLTTKGLSAFAQTPTLAGPSAVTPLLEELGTYLDTQGIARADVQVSLLATAGLRNVRTEDPAAAQAILASSRAAITAAEFPVADARILPAVQEATLAWLDANVLGNTLGTPRSSVGIIEIGGASAQIAYRSPNAKGRAVHLVRVDGQVIPVVGLSYLGLGGNDVRSLMQVANDAGSFCFPNNAPGAAPILYLPSASRPVAADTARFNWDRCAKAFGATIADVGAVRTAAAPIPPSAVRSLDGFTAMRFIGIGGIPFVFADLRIGEATRKRVALRRAVATTCEGADAWPKVAALFEGRSAAFADTLCPSGVSQYEFLFGDQGLGVSPQRLTIPDASQGRQPAWPSGYAITILDP